MAIGQMTRFNLTYELDRVVPGNRILIVLTPVYTELEKLSSNESLKVQKEAQIALSFVEKECEIWKTDYDHKNVDFILLTYGQNYSGLIATNDRKLKRLARKKGIRTLYIRNQRYLVIE
jgi:rRNA-processing protein FCF1